MDGPPLLRPLPRRPNRPSPAFLDVDKDSLPDTPPESTSPSSYFGGSKTRSRSIINLTSGALFGIYGPQHMNEPPTDPSSPVDTGPETPITPLTQSDGSLDGYRWEGPGEVAGAGYLEARRRPPTGLEVTRRLKERQLASKDDEVKTASPVPVSNLWRAFRAVFLFVVGVAYGALVAILPVHGDAEHLRAYCEQVLRDYKTFAYLVAWGVAGAVLGTGLPVLDRFLQQKARQPAKVHHHKQRRRASSEGQNSGQVSKPSLIEEFSPTVRSIGAFVGVAFAIRRLQWETTLQLSATLALTNPFLWYLLDRTSAGLAVATAVAGLGTATVLVFGNGMFPVPVDALVQSPNGNNEIALGEAVWVASVLFWSCVCFGSVGRLLRSR